jgi:CheY-like chemotaxis protein
MNRSQTTLLMVEDSQADVLLFRRALHKANLSNPLHVVGDGDAAVSYLGGQGAYADRQQFPLPAAVLLDLKLPRRSGLEVLAWIRLQPALRRLPVVMFTSSDSSSDIDHAYDLGANSYLIKPVSFEALQGLVRLLVPYWLEKNEPPATL